MYEWHIWFGVVEIGCGNEDMAGRDTDIEMNSSSKMANDSASASIDHQSYESIDNSGRGKHLLRHRWTTMTRV